MPMNLVYIAPYLSIRKFNPVLIEDFTIFTGLNGSGKTHLLRAIKNGSVLIEGFEKSEIVYYSYNDFMVYTGNIDQDQALKNKLSVRAHEVKTLLDRISQVKNRSVNEVLSKYSQAERILVNFINSFSQYAYFESWGVLKDFDIVIEQIKNEEINLQSLELLKAIYNPNYISVISQYLAFADPTLLNINYIKRLYDGYAQQVEEGFNKYDPSLYAFVKNNTDSKHILSISERDFESPDIFLKDIANEEKEYQFLKITNQHNKTAAEWGDNVQYIEKEEFIKKYGQSPITQINEILNEYDCNGYELVTNQLHPQFGMDKSHMNIHVSLNQKTHNYSAQFDGLSSGEKTLMALALFVYKYKKNRLNPRVILLDEIDSSLHPSMINRLLNVLQEIFIKKQGFKIILVTHSPSTVALSPDNSIFIVNKDGPDKILKQEKAEAIKILSEGFVTLNIEDSNLGIEYNLSQNNLPIVFTEGITDKIILDTAWQKIYGSRTKPFYIQDCFDAPFLGNFFQRADDSQDGIFSKYPDRTFISLFDFDDEGYNRWNSLDKKYPIISDNPYTCLTRRYKGRKAFSLLLPVPQNIDILKQVISEKNETYKHESHLTIELLFYGIEKLANHFVTKNKAGGGKIISFKGDKKKFSNDISMLDAKDFAAFLPLFDKIEKIISQNI